MVFPAESLGGIGMGDGQSHGCRGGRGTGEIVPVRSDEGGPGVCHETAELDAYREDVDSMACMMLVDNIYGTSIKTVQVGYLYPRHA